MFRVWTSQGEGSRLMLISRLHSGEPVRTFSL